MEQFQEKVNELFAKHETLLSRKNIPLEDGNGIFTRYQHPVLTAAHTPIFWSCLLYTSDAADEL